MIYNGSTVITGTKIGDKTYVLHTGPAKSANALAMAARNPTMTELHRSLGHTGGDRIKQLLQNLGFRAPVNDTIECEFCPAGQAKRSSHPRKGVRAEEAGHIHVDLSGIINKVSLNGYQYYMLCKDEFTDFDLVYFCRSKTEVPSLLAKMVVDFESYSNTPVKSIKSDNGSEFVNKMTELLFAKEKVKHETSAPFCSQQNGRIEREMQSIQNMARTMLNASKLPEELWPEAVATAVYLKNRLPNSHNKCGQHK